MIAVILAAGKGTRMKELTNEAPKPMLRVKGKPILEHILRGVVEAGVQEVFIVTGFRAEVIEDYFGDGAGWSARIVYGRQEVQDGTGKAPELARGFVGSSPFILTYGDILAGPEIYARMIRRFNEAAFAGVSLFRQRNRFPCLTARARGRGPKLNEPTACSLLLPHPTPLPSKLIQTP